MFRVHLDDSGDQQQAGAFAVGGYLGYGDQFDHAQRNWDETLAAFNKRHHCNIRYFHTTDLVNGYADFAGLDESVRVSLLENLMALIRCRVIEGVGSSMRMEHYLQVFGSPRDKSRLFPAPLSICFIGAYLLSKGWALKHKTQDQPMAYIIERGSLYRGELIDGFNLSAEDPRSGGRYPFDSISQAPKEVVGLQMADLFAWGLGAERKALFRAGRLSEVFRRPLDHFFMTFRHDHYPWDIEKLQESKDGTLELVQAAVEADLAGC